GRTLKSNGTWWTGLRLGNGTMSLDVTNPSGALNRFDADPVILTATGYRNSAVQRLKVTLAPGMNLKAYTCLNTVVCAAGTISFSSATYQGSGQLIAANGNPVNASSSTIYPDVECPGSISGGGYQGAKRTVTTPRTMPGSSVFDYYVANGTAIPVSICPTYTATKALNQTVLSPT